MKVTVVALWVWTVRLVLPLIAMGHQVTEEVVLELWPMRHRTVPRVRHVWHSLWDSRFVVKGEGDFGFSSNITTGFD